MAKSKETATQPDNIVYVAYYRYSDRHGSEGMSILGVRSKKEKAEKLKSDDIQKYLQNNGLLNSDGTLNTDSISEIDGDDAEGKTLEDALTADSIKVDDEGTWCEWDISEEPVL